MTKIISGRAPNTPIRYLKRDLEIRESSIENFLKDNFNHNWYNLKVNTFLDLSNFDYKLESYDKKKDNIVFNRLLSFTMIESGLEYIVRTNRYSFSCNQNTKLFVKDTVAKKKYSILPITSILKQKTNKFTLQDNEWVEFTVTQTDNEIAFIHFEIENTNSLYSNHILSM